MIYHCNPLPADVLASASFAEGQDRAFAYVATEQFSLSGLSLAVGFSEMIGTFLFSSACTYLHVFCSLTPQGRRPTQEDALLLHGSLGGEKGTDLIGVFDGHASRVPALFCAEKFPGILAAKLKVRLLLFCLLLFFFFLFSFFMEYCLALKCYHRRMWSRSKHSTSRSRKSTANSRQLFPSTHITGDHPLSQPEPPLTGRRKWYKRQQTGALRSSAEQLRWSVSSAEATSVSFPPHDRHPACPHARRCRQSGRHKSRALS